MSATMVSPRKINLKLRWLKRPKIALNKWNLDQNINDSEPNSFSLNFRFYSRKTQSQQKLLKKITRFTIQFTQKSSLILRASTHSKHCKKYTPATKGKTFPTFQICFWLVSEITFAMHHFGIFLYIAARKLLFQRRRNFLSGGGGLNNFLKEGRCLSLVKCFKIFHFNWNFWKFSCSAFWIIHQ